MTPVISWINFFKWVLGLSRTIRDWWRLFWAIFSNLSMNNMLYWENPENTREAPRKYPTGHPKHERKFQMHNGISEKNYRIQISNVSTLCRPSALGERERGLVETRRHYARGFLQHNVIYKVGKTNPFNRVLVQKTALKKKARYLLSLLPEQPRCGKFRKR